MSKYDLGALIFSGIGSVWYVCWAAFSYYIPEQRHMTVALLFYSCANIALVWPVLRKVL